MGLNTRRLEYLRCRVEYLQAEKERLLTPPSFNEMDRDARETWAEQLDSTIRALRQSSAELADLEREED